MKKALSIRFEIKTNVLQSRDVNGWNEVKMIQTIKNKKFNFFEKRG